MDWLVHSRCALYTVIPQYTQIPKSEDAQVSYIKCHRTMHMVGPPHLQIPNREMKTKYIDCFRSVAG